MDFRLLYITAGSRDEAKKIGRALVEERLVACANVIDGMESVYWWQGKLIEDREAILIVKTRADLVASVTARVKALHSYTVPCVVALPILDGNPAYLEWLAAETTTPVKTGWRHPSQARRAWRGCGRRPCRSGAVDGTIRQ